MARTSRDMILWFFLALLFISFLLMGKLFFPFFSVIVLASVIASIFHPVHQRLEAKIKPAYASLLTCILIFFVFFIPIVFIITIIAGEAHSFVLYFKNSGFQVQIIDFLEKNRILERFNAISDRFQITMNYGDLVQPLSDLGTFIGFNLINQANTLAGYLINFIIGSCLIIIVIYYLLLDGKRLVNYIIELSPLPNDEDLTILKKFKEMSSAVLISNGISGAIQGVIGGIICSYFGLHSPLLWGLVIGFFSFLPIFGIGIVIFPIMIFLVFKGQFIVSLCLFIIYIIVTAGIEYLIRPALVGKRVRMHPLLVFFSIIGGIYMSGILGVIFGPLIMTFFLTLLSIYRSNYRKRIDPNSDPSYEDSNPI